MGLENSPRFSRLLDLDDDDCTECALILLLSLIKGGEPSRLFVLKHYRRRPLSTLRNEFIVNDDLLRQLVRTNSSTVTYGCFKVLGSVPDVISGPRSFESCLIGICCQERCLR